MADERHCHPFAKVHLFVCICKLSLLRFGLRGCSFGSERVRLGAFALPVVGGGAGAKVIDYRPLRAAMGAVGQGLRFEERVCHLYGRENAVVPAQEDCLVAVGLLAARDSLFGSTEIVVVEYVGRRYAALREEEVEARIARDGHAVEAVGQFFDGLGRFAQFVHAAARHACANADGEQKVEVFHAVLF